MELFDALKDGVILCLLINAAQADTIDLRVVHTGQAKPLSVYEVVENLNIAINAAVAIGCRVVNIGHDDILSGAPHLVLGLLWQIVKVGIMAKINLKASPELIALLPEKDQDDKEALRALLAMPPEKVRPTLPGAPREMPAPHSPCLIPARNPPRANHRTVLRAARQVLLKWLNFHVQRVSPGAKEVANFGPALKDCSVYAHLLSAVAPPEQQEAMAKLPGAVASTAEPLARAQMIIEAAATLGVTQFKVFAADITKGNEKLNMGFTAAIFNHLPGLAAPAEHGTFAPTLAHASVEIKEGGHAVRLAAPGCALFGTAMLPKSGAHWVELRVLEATSASCFLGLAHESCDKGKHVRAHTPAAPRPRRAPVLRPPPRRRCPPCSAHHPHRCPPCVQRRRRARAASRLARSLGGRRGLAQRRVGPLRALVVLLCHRRPRAHRVRRDAGPRLVGEEWRAAAVRPVARRHAGRAARHQGPALWRRADGGRARGARTQRTAPSTQPGSRPRTPTRWCWRSVHQPPAPARRRAPHPRAYPTRCASRAARSPAARRCSACPRRTRATRARSAPSRCGSTRSASTRTSRTRPPRRARFGRSAPKPSPCRQARGPPPRPTARSPIPSRLTASTRGPRAGARRAAAAPADGHDQAGRRRLVQGHAQATQRPRQSHQLVRAHAAPLHSLSPSPQSNN